ncbi:MAG: EAL domain-containing protein [Gammaproteobacteria bacterium]|jgi:EAL domain-containing protein (putative c-di-GMP-specific phosphodiesterase class I)
MDFESLSVKQEEPEPVSVRPPTSKAEPVKARVPESVPVIPPAPAPEPIKKEVPDPILVTPSLPKTDHVKATESVPVTPPPTRPIPVKAKAPEPVPVIPPAPAPELIKKEMPDPLLVKPPAPTPEAVKEKVPASVTPPPPKTDPVKASQPVPVTPPPPKEIPVKSKAPEIVQPKVAQESVSVPSQSRQLPAEARPKKSLAELKAEMEKAKRSEIDNNTIEKQTETTSDPDHESSITSQLSVKEVELDVSNMSDSAKSIKKAFEEQRIIQAYQPIISLLNDEMDNEDEMHNVSLIQIEDDGTLKSDDDIRALLSTAEFQKFVDHWSLREIIGLLANRQNTTDTFIIKLSDASLSDAGFFNSLRKLLTGLEEFNPGKYLVLQIDSNDLSSLEKQAGALIPYLRKSHDFKFILGNVKNVDEIINYATRIQFDLIRCSTNIIKELQNMTIDADMSTENSNAESSTHLDLIKSKGTRFISDDIENATALTEAIGLGVEYAMGDFIGEPLTQLDDSTNIESFEIS